MRSREVHARPPRRRAARSSIARSPVPVATSSAREPGPDAGEVGRARAPAVVHPGRHERVHPVVDARDAVEHRAHLRLGQRPGRACSRTTRSLLLALERRDVLDELVELLRVGLLLKRRVRRHRRRRVDERARDRVAARGARRSRSGSGPSVLPFSPILWQPRQPEEAVIALPSSYCGAVASSISVGEPASAPSTVR